MKRKQILKALVLAGCMAATNAEAQLSTNPDKFLGNITTRYNVDTDGITYWHLWNQITGENESKWASVEGTQGRFTWGGSDNCYNYAKNHNFPFKFHAIIWGAQHPNWFNGNMSVLDRYKAIKSWMGEIKKHYDTIDLIDVANECVLCWNNDSKSYQPHQADSWLFYEPLGGQGVTGYDWLVKAFEMAHEKWPEAVLIYNDYNTFQWNTNEFIDLVTKLRDAGAPIDAYGCQSHDLTDCSLDNFKNSMNKLQSSLKMPMYISEYDLGTDDDNHQKNQMSAQFPLMWEADYCAGVTLWGFIYGATWTTNGNSGLIKNGKDRPAMTWLREYMASDKAKNAKSPYPGMKKPISFYIKPAKYKAPINEPCPITIEANTHNGTTVEKVELYINDQPVSTMTEAPYVYEYTPQNENRVNLKAIAYTSDGKQYERLGGMYGSKWPQRPYPEDGEPLLIPGVLEAENFDMGGEGISYHNTRTGEPMGTIYRDDQESLYISSLSDGGFFLGQNAENEWYDYSIHVDKGPKFNYEAIVGSTGDDSEFTIYIYKDGELKAETVITVPKTGRRKFTSVTGSIPYRFSAGDYKLRIYFNKTKAFIDKIYIGTTAEAVGIEQVAGNDSDETFDIYTTTGIFVGRAEGAENVKQKLAAQPGNKNIYIIRNAKTGKSRLVTAE